MATTDERMQVLKMIEEGKISVEEGTELLRLLSKSEAGTTAEPLRGASKPRRFRVRVTDLNSGRSKVSVNIPMGLVDVGLRMGARFVPELESDQYGELVEMVRAGKQGKVIDVVDDDSGEHIEVFVE